MYTIYIYIYIYIYITVIEDYAVLIYNIVGKCYYLIINLRKLKLPQTTAIRKEKSSLTHSVWEFLEKLTFKKYNFKQLYLKN